MNYRRCFLSFLVLAISILLIYGQVFAQTDNDWRVKFDAVSGSTQSLDQYAGVKASAADGWDINDQAAPPAPFPPYVQFVFPHFDWGTYSDNYVEDYRSQIDPGSSKSWEVNISSSGLSQDITITWNLSNAPSNYTFTLNGQDMRVVSQIVIPRPGVQ